MDWNAAGQKTLQVGAYDLEYQTWGPPPDAAPTIVLLHEGLGSVAQWKDFPEKLAGRSGYGVFAYSRAGYGQSSPVELPRPLDYMAHEAIDVLPELLRAIGFQRGLLLGHSDGASIASIYLGSVEDFRVRGLCLMAPHFFTETSGLAAIATAKQAYEAGNLRERLAKYHSDPDNAFHGWNDAWLDGGFKTWNIEEVIGYFRVPTLAIQGEEDQYGTIAQISALQEQAYSPVDIALIQNCGHAPHIEQQQQTLEVICDFIARLDAIESQSLEVA